MPTHRIDEEQAWQQVVIREQAADFFYAVTTTGVFCRPSCTSRRPLRAERAVFQDNRDRTGCGVPALQALQAHCVGQTFGHGSWAY